MCLYNQIMIQGRMFSKRHYSYLTEVPESPAAATEPIMTVMLLLLI